jgi:hypothetical protein
MTGRGERCSFPSESRDARKATVDGLVTNLEFDGRIGCIDEATLGFDWRAADEPGTPAELLQKAGVGIPGEFSQGSPGQNSHQEETSQDASDSEFACCGAVICVLTFVASAPAARPAPNGQPTSAAAAPSPERHREIDEAIASLRRAREHMEHAAHDFGGHRLEALKATDEATHPLEVCLKYDGD